LKGCWFQSDAKCGVGQGIVRYLFVPSIIIENAGEDHGHSIRLEEHRHSGGAFFEKVVVVTKTTKWVEASNVEL
jgi:hypothetical protein